MLTGTADSGDRTAPATSGRIVAQRRGDNDARQTSEGTSIAADSKGATGRRADLLSLGSYVLGALWIIAPLLIHYGRTMPSKPGDRAQAEWFLGHAARFVTHGGNPFHITQLNAPYGVNAMANTSMLALGIPMSPITLLFGANVSFDILIVLGVAGSAFAWYWALSRHLVTNRAAAWVGGLVGGFAPTVTSHAQYHPNLVAQFVVPLLVWRTFKLLEPGRAVRNGLWLAALVVLQVFINEETLFLAALATGLLLLLFAVQHRDRVRGALRPLAQGLGVTAGASLVVLAYPLYYQFLGPDSYRGGEPYMTTFRMDVFGLTTYGSNSVAERFRQYGSIPLPFGAEEHGYFGWSLVLLLLALIVWQWHDRWVRCLTVTGVVFAVLAWGSPLLVKGDSTHIPGPFALLQHLPLFDTLLPTRLGEVTNWAVTPLLAICAQRLFELPGLAGRTRKILLVGVLGAALVPAAPMPIKTVARPPVPSFVSSGQWRNYVGPGQTVLVVPLPQWDFEAGIYWAASTDTALPLSHGYFLGPADGIKGHHAFVGPVPRPTDKLFSTAMWQRVVPEITAADREQAKADLRFWHVSLILVPDGAKSTASRLTVEQLFGPGRATGGLTMWDVRNL